MATNDTAVGFGASRTNVVRIPVILAETLPGQNARQLWQAWAHNATVVGDGKPRRVRGWTYRSHDGVERFVEGTWAVLVQAVTLTAENYGATAKVS